MPIHGTNRCELGRGKGGNSVAQRVEQEGLRRHDQIGAVQLRRDQVRYRHRLKSNGSMTCCPCPSGSEVLAHVVYGEGEVYLEAQPNFVKLMWAGCRARLPSCVAHAQHVGPVLILLNQLPLASAMGTASRRAETSKPCDCPASSCW